VVLRLVQAMVLGIYLTSLASLALSSFLLPSLPAASIAITEVWYRLAALCTLSACPAAGRPLSPFQISIGMKGSSQVAGYALRADIAADPRLHLCANRLTEHLQHPAQGQDAGRG
jgi:hypothetical protein